MITLGVAQRFVQALEDARQLLEIDLGPELVDGCFTTRPAARARACPSSLNAKTCERPSAGFALRTSSPRDSSRCRALDIVMNGTPSSPASTVVVADCIRASNPSTASSVPSTPAAASSAGNHTLRAMSDRPQLVQHRPRRRRSHAFSSCAATSARDRESAACAAPGRSRSPARGRRGSARSPGRTVADRAGRRCAGRGAGR